MNPNYTLWYMHSEKTIRGLATSSYSTGPTANAAGVATKNVGNMHWMLRDAFGMHPDREDNCQPQVVV